MRSQLSKALGGRRGMVEAAVPTILFTLIWLTVRDLRTALVVGVAAALVMLVVRLVQRSSVQFVVNALFGIGIGWLFVALAARGGASGDEQALAYFLPGILYNGGYAVVMAFTVLIGWPLVGFMVGSVTGDPTAWHEDKQIVRLCSRLTWLLVLPCVDPRGNPGSDLAGRQRRRAGGGHRDRAARRPEDRAGLAAAAGRPRCDGVGARPQPHPDRPVRAGLSRLRPDVGWRSAAVQ